MEAKVMPRSLEREHPILDWLTYERRNWIGLVTVAALAGFAFGNGHTTSGAVEHISDQLGQKSALVHRLTAANNCESKRGDKAAEVAKQAIRGALIDTAPVPSPSQIPADNCPHVSAK